MNVRPLLMRLVWPGCLIAVLMAPALPVAGQERDRPDGAAESRREAREWAFRLFKSFSDSIRQAKDKRITFQPMGKDAVLLDRRHRRRLYRWMLRALRETAEITHYRIINPTDYRAVDRVLKNADVKNSSEVYLETLRQHGLTKFNLSCEGGDPESDGISLDCIAIDIHNLEQVGTASVRFDAEWLERPVPLDSALDDVAGQIVSALRGGVDAIEIVDYRTDTESRLTERIARSLKVKVVRKSAERAAAPPVGGAGNEAARYRVEGGIDYLDKDDKLELRLTFFWNDQAVDAVEEYITITSRIRDLLESGGAGAAGSGDRGADSRYTLHRMIEASDILGLKAELAAGADVNGRDPKSWTPLMYAASNGYMLMVQPLLEAGADPNVIDLTGATALHMASEKGYLAVVDMLLKAGADPAIRESRGRSAVDVATAAGSPEIVELINAAARRRKQELMAEADDAAFSRAKEANTAVAYLSYLSSYPAGSHREEAEAALGPGVYLAVDVAAGERIDGRHVQAAVVEGIASGEIRGHSMIAGGCYARARPVGSRLEWADVAATCSR